MAPNIIIYFQSKISNKMDQIVTNENILLFKGEEIIIEEKYLPVNEGWIFIYFILDYNFKLDLFSRSS